MEMQTKFSQTNLPKVGDTVSKYDVAGITDYWMLVSNFHRVPVPGSKWLYDLQGTLEFIGKEQTEEYFNVLNSMSDVTVCHFPSGCYVYTMVKEV